MSKGIPIPEGKLKLGKALLSGGLITREVLERELQSSSKADSKMGKALLNCNFPTEQELIQVIARNIRVPNVRITALKASPKVVAEIPKEIAKEHRVLALEKIGGILVVVTPNIGNEAAFSAVRQATGCFLAPIRCPEDGFTEAIENFYQNVSAPKPQEQPTTPSNDPKPSTDSNTPKDPEAVFAIPAQANESSGAVEVQAGYYNILSIFEHLYTHDGPIPAELVE